MRTHLVDPAHPFLVGRIVRIIGNLSDLAHPLAGRFQAFSMLFLSHDAGPFDSWEFTVSSLHDNWQNVERTGKLLHDRRYPPASLLREKIRAGQPLAGPRVPVEQSVGEGKDTEASECIIRVVDRTDRRSVWVVIWGGSADLAQALWKVRKNRTPEELDGFLSKLRVHAINDQDSTGPWIRE